MYQSYFPNYLSVKDAARKYDIDKDRLRRLISTGQLRTIQPFGRGTPRLIAEEGLTSVGDSAKHKGLPKTHNVLTTFT